MLSRLRLATLLLVLLALSGCTTTQADISYDDPFHQFAANVELNISSVVEHPDTLTPRKITYTEISHDLLTETLPGEVEVSQMNTSEEEDGVPFYKTILQSNSGPYWVAMDGDIHMYTYVKDISSVSHTSTQIADSVQPEAADQAAAELLLEQIGITQMVLDQCLQSGNTTSLSYRYANVDNIVCLDRPSRQGTLLPFEFSYAEVILEAGVVQSMTVFRPYTITGVLESEPVLTPKEAAIQPLNELSQGPNLDETVVLNNLYLAWAVYATQYELRPYWIFTNSERPEWRIAVDAITGNVIR